MPETKLARISSISMGMHEKGFRCFDGSVDYGDGGQGFGGICLDTFDDTLKQRIITDQCALAIGKIMIWCSFDLAKCVNRTVVVHRDSDRWDAKIVGLEWPMFNSFGRGTKLMFADLFPDLEPPKAICPECKGHKRWPIPCPDGKPGCAVAHFRNCSICNKDGKSIL